MNSVSLSIPSNIFGLVVGSLTLLLAIVDVFKRHLPSRKIKEMEDVLQQTEATLMETIEEGFLVNEFAQVVEHRLRTLKADARDLRLETFKITSYRQEFLGFIRGTSAAIGSTCDSLKKLRAEIVTSREQRRRRLQEMGWIVSTSPQLNLTTDIAPKHPATIRMSPHSSRPSVLPALSTIYPTADGNESNEIESKTYLESRASTDSLEDSTQSYPDARTIDASDVTSILHTSVNLEREA